MLRVGDHLKARLGWAWHEHGARPNDVAYVTTSRMIEVDRAMVEDFKIALIQMMESAGCNLAHLARVRFLGGTRGTSASSCWRERQQRRRRPYVD